MQFIINISYYLQQQGIRQCSLSSIFPIIYNNKASDNAVYHQYFLLFTTTRHQTMQFTINISYYLQQQGIRQCSLSSIFPIIYNNKASDNAVYHQYFLLFTTTRHQTMQFIINISYYLQQQGIRQCSLSSIFPIIYNNKASDNAVYHQYFLLFTTTRHQTMQFTINISYYLQQQGIRQCSLSSIFPIIYNNKASDNAVYHQYFLLFTTTRHQTMQFTINISYYLQQQGIRQCSLSSIFPIIYNNKASDNAVYHQYFLLFTTTRHQTMQFTINISYYLQQQGIRQCSLSSIFPIIYNNKASDNAVYHQYFLLFTTTRHQTMQFIINISYYLQQQGIRQCSLSSIFPIIYNNKASDNAVYHQYFLLFTTTRHQTMQFIINISYYLQQQGIRQCSLPSIFPIIYNNKASDNAVYHQYFLLFTTTRNQTMQFIINISYYLQQQGIRQCSLPSIFPIIYNNKASDNAVYHQYFLLFTTTRHQTMQFIINISYYLQQQGIRQCSLPSIFPIIYNNKASDNAVYHQYFLLFTTTRHQTMQFIINISYYLQQQGIRQCSLPSIFPIINIFRKTD